MENKMEWFCAGHWLKCLYNDFLNERVAGEKLPCASCEMKNKCQSCPPINFIPLMEKCGMEIGFNPLERKKMKGNKKRKKTASCRKQSISEKDLMVIRNLAEIQIQELFCQSHKNDTAEES